jgi:hypothetical protein
MTEPECVALHEAPPEYVDLANTLAALGEWLFLCGARRGEYPIVFSEDGFGLRKMEERIRQALVSGKIRGYFQEGSEFFELPEPLWKYDTAWKAVRTGRPLEIPKETTEVMFRPLVKYAEIFSVAFPDKDQPPSPSAEATASAPRPPQPTAPSAESTEPGQDDGSPPPYLVFMLRIAEELRLDGRRISKKTIYDYLEENWPPELGPPTRAKLTKMATFLGNPEHEKGGLLPANYQGPRAKR